MIPGPDLDASKSENHYEFESVFDTLKLLEHKEGTLTAQDLEFDWKLQ